MGIATPILMRSIGIVSFCFLLALPAFGQYSFKTEPPVAASGPDYRVSVGYTFMTMPIPGAGRANINGLDAAAHVDFNPRWGAMLDSNYARTANVLSTSHQAYAWSFRGGPVVYPRQNDISRLFVHALFGGSLVDGALPSSDTQYRHGWQTGFSYALGGGLERRLAGPIAMRGGLDYVRSTFFDSLGTLQPQNSFQITLSVLWNVRERLHHPRRGADSPASYSESSSRVLVESPAQARTTE